MDEEDKKHYQSITGATMYLGQVSRYDILLTVNQLAMAISKPLQAYMEAAKHQLRYLIGSVNFSVTYK